MLFQFYSYNKSLLTLKHTYYLSHHCVSSDVSLNRADVKNSFHRKSMNVVSHSNELSGDSSDLKPMKMSSRTDHIHAVSLQCG